MTLWIARAAVALLVLVATAWDIRKRELPAWLTIGGIASGLLVGGLGGLSGLELSALGIAAGGLILLPMVALGGFGIGDAFLLAAIGAWQGWHFVLGAVFWAALAGALMAFVAWRRKHASFPYVPAIGVGTLIALITTGG